MPGGRPLKEDGDISPKINDKHPDLSGYRTRLTDRLLFYFKSERWQEEAKGAITTRRRNRADLNG